MKRNLLNFTRGSQLLGHFGFMFAAGLKGPLLVTFLVSAWLCYLEVTSSLTDHQMYLAWMHLYASGYAFMEFDPGKLVELKLAGGGTVRIPFNLVREFPPMREAVTALGDALRRGVGLSALVLIPAFAAFWWFAERFGGKSKERKHERGAMLVTLDELEAERRARCFSAMARARHEPFGRAASVPVRRTTALRSSRRNAFRSMPQTGSGGSKTIIAEDCSMPTRRGLRRSKAPGLPWSPPQACGTNWSAPTRCSGGLTSLTRSMPIWRRG